MILGVMLEDLSIVQAKRQGKQKQKERKISSFNRTAKWQIVTRSRTGRCGQVGCIRGVVLIMVRGDIGVGGRGERRGVHSRQ